MVTNLRHYTYKITFPGMPWFYYGVHTDNGKPYLGSPKTHAWRWKMYECEIQILEWFESRKNAEKVERRLIKHFINDPNCLNAQVGGQPTLEQRLKGVETQIKNKIGIYGEDKPWKKEAHKKAIETMKKDGTGLFDVEVKRKGGKTIGNKHVESGHIKRLGKKQGRKNEESGLLKKVRSSAAKAQHSLRYKCLVTGYISTPCGLTHYQRARDIDTSLRVKVNSESARS